MGVVDADEFNELRQHYENVRYGVSLSAAASYVVPDGQIASILKEGAPS